MRPILATLAMTFLGCPAPSPTAQDRCRPSCAGCCDLSGACLAGATNASCGQSGEACTPCGAGLGCANGRCSASGQGGGLAVGGGAAVGGGSAVGGGTSMGGGVARVNQELVSGTRLRAINLVGGDGSRRSTQVFWDNQLQFYCSVPDPTASSADARRPPECRGATISAGTFGLSDYDYAFSDPTCRTKLGIGSAAVSALLSGGSTVADPLSALFVDAGLPAIEPLRVAELGDGGWLSVTPFTGPVYRLFVRDGGCETFATPPGAYFVLGAPTTRPAFATMSAVRE